MDMPKLTDGHLKLEILAGTWEGEETMYPSQWDPKGGVGDARSESRIALGGFALITDYQQARDGVVTFTGHGVYTYDAKEARITLHWFDGLGSPPEVFVGGFDGDVLTLAHGDPGMHVRITHDLTTPGTMRSRMEMSDDGSGWKALFDGVYRRRG